jgi:hypothetical protein
MNDQDIIKLAEFIGLIPHGGMWYFPDTKSVRKTPQPHTDANDCDALIRALNEAGIAVSITHYTNGVSNVLLGHFKAGHWNGDDYKQGVCELALKVIDEKGA